MLNQLEYIIDEYERNYGIRLGDEPEFDKIFSPVNITSVLNLYGYSRDTGIAGVYNIVRAINQKITIDKQVKQKKDFNYMFANNFLALRLAKMSNKVIFKENTLKNMQRLGVAEYDTGHELIEQKKPYPLKFLEKAKINLINYLNERKEQGDNDVYALSQIAGTHLEVAFAIYDNKDHIENAQNKIIENIQTAFIFLEQALEIKRINFQKYFIERFDNFVAYTKKYMKGSNEKHYEYLRNQSVLINKMLNISPTWNMHEKKPQHSI